jgi:hypothetical protein
LAPEVIDRNDGLGDQGGRAGIDLGELRVFEVHRGLTGFAAAQGQDEGSVENAVAVVEQRLAIRGHRLRPRGCRRARQSGPHSQALKSILGPRSG